MVRPMPCDCPEDQPQPIPQGGCNYLIYSGGPMANFYRLVEHAMPDVEMSHGRPNVHPDGSLEFPDTPPALSGYRAEGSRRLPIWPSCALRMLRVQVIDSTLHVDGICGGPTAAPFSLEITPDQCQGCPARQDRL